MPKQPDKFLSQLTTLGILAHERGTQAKHIAARLDARGVAPIKLPTNLSKIYRLDVAKDAHA